VLLLLQGLAQAIRRLLTLLGWQRARVES
jgi:hypothetical protein